MDESAILGGKCASNFSRNLSRAYPCVSYLPISVERFPNCTVVLNACTSLVNMHVADLGTEAGQAG